MEEYPSEYVAVVRPLVVLLGVETDDSTHHDLPKPLNNGAGVHLDAPAIDSSTAAAVWRALTSFNDASTRTGAESEDSLSQTNQSLICHLRWSNRDLTFPSRKASPAPSQVYPIGTNPTHLHSPALHSPLSPLSPGSATHPDGLLSSLWFLKYREALPSVLISFLEIAHSVNDNMLNDNHLKAEINSFQTTLSEVNYKGKHIVVLCGHQTVKDDAGLETRLSNIRKGAKLDNKATFFYIPPDIPAPDLDLFAEAVVQAARTFWLDFYKNLHKHARRKKDRRSSSLPTTPTTEGLPQQLLHAGWNCRYAVKMGIFSEMRLELDAASKSYAEALDHLLDPGGVFDQTSPLSPRFNEARLLADSVAIRRLRCLLADGSTAAAAQFWTAYHDRTRDVVERRGKGSGTFGWPCWEARWAKSMAELVQGAPSLAVDSNARKSLGPLHSRQRAAYLVTERRNRLQESGNPWTGDLHNPGYWYTLSARYQVVRATLASEIPEEDRNPPGSSPASSVARVHREYESYLCPEPHVEATQVDHTNLIVTILHLAREEHAGRGHVRAASICDLAISKQGLTLSNKQRGVGNGELGGSLASSTQHWTSISRELVNIAFGVARLHDDLEKQILSSWRMTHRHQSPQDDKAPSIMQLVDAANEKRQEGSRSLSITSDHHNDLVSLNVSFEVGDVSAGERARLQVSLSSAASTGTPAIEFGELRVDFEGLPEVLITHEDGTSSSAEDDITEVTLHEGDDEESEELCFTGSANLVMFAGQTRVLVMSLPLREVGEVRVTRASLSVFRRALSLQFSKDLTSTVEPFHWYTTRAGAGLIKQRQRWDAGSLRVLPKQPKMMVLLPDLRSSYYVGEIATIGIELVNEEVETVDAVLEISLTGATGQDGTPMFTPGEETGVMPAKHQGAVCKTVGTMSHASRITTAVALSVPPAHDGLSLEIEVRYSSQADPQSQITKISSTKLSVTEPFSAHFTLEPLLHPAPWPSYFDADAPGLSVCWRLKLHLESQASEDLIISDTHVRLLEVGEGASCELQKPETKEVMLAPSQSVTPAFVINIEKTSLDDTRPATIDAAMDIVWRRAGSAADETVNTTIPTPRLNLPTSEPRSLATRFGPDDNGSIKLSVTLENPSMHYLSFEITLEPTDDFVLSGHTRKSLNLIPLSRQTVDFVILPMVQGTHLRPLVKVVDTYFNKLLHIHPGEGLEVDEAGNMLVWVDEVG